MEAKKSISANLENDRWLFLLIGFVFVLGFLYIAFEWAKTDIKIDTTGVTVEAIEQEDVVLQTAQQQAPPPPAAVPPAVIPPVITVVDHPVVAGNTDVFTEKPLDAVVAPPPPPPAVVDEDKDAQVVFVVVEKNPDFPGGMPALYEYLGKKINYPPGPKEAGIQGRVICQFVVNTDGSIVDIQVVKGVDPELDKEAVRVIGLMPKWIPGEQSGKKVRVKYTLPIVFKINQ